MPTAPRLAALILFPACLAFGAWTLAFGTPYAQRLLAMAGIYAVMATGYHLAFGQAGALSLVQGAFMGLGGYVAGIGALRLGLPPAATLPLAALLPVLLASLVAPVLRLRTHAFALATLLVAQMLGILATEWVSFTGGANGLSGLPGLGLGGLSLARGIPLVFTVWGFAALGGLLAWGLMRGRRGHVYALLRAAPDAAAACGIDGARLRFAAFLFASGYAGLAGALMAHTLRVVSPDALGFPAMVTCLTICVLGGRFRVMGVIAGAILVVHLPEWFRPLHDAYLLAYGLLLLAMIVIAPTGLAGTLEAGLARLLPPATPLLPPPVPLAASFRPLAPLLRLQSLSCRFGGVHALQNIDLALDPGQALGLIGPNGSGKTTLVNAITGLVRPQSGSIRLGGRDLAGLPPHLIARAGIARTFQTAALVDDMAALDAVALVSPGREARAEAMFLLGRLGIAPAATLPCGALPQSVRRRVEIARALALRPRLLLLDEPAAGLDEAEQHDLARRLRTLPAEGVALLVIDHAPAFLTALVSRLACLDGGRLIAEGTPEAVWQDPAVLTAYLGRI